MSLWLIGASSHSSSSAQIARLEVILSSMPPCLKCLSGLMAAAVQVSCPCCCCTGCRRADERFLLPYPVTGWHASMLTAVPCRVQVS